MHSEKARIVVRKGQAKLSTIVSALGHRGTAVSKPQLPRRVLLCPSAGVLVISNCLYALGVLHTTAQECPLFIRRCAHRPSPRLLRCRTAARVVRGLARSPHTTPGSLMDSDIVRFLLCLLEEGDEPAEEQEVLWRQR